MKLQAREKSALKLLVAAALLLLLVLNASTAWGLLGTLWGILSPIVLGCILAFVLNIPMESPRTRVFPSQHASLHAESTTALSVLFSPCLLLCSCLCS